MTLSLVLTACALSVATSPPLRLVRGEVDVTALADRGGVTPAAFATVVLLVPTARPLDDDGGRSGPAAPEAAAVPVSDDGDAGATPPRAPAPRTTP